MSSRTDGAPITDPARDSIDHATDQLWLRRAWILIGGLFLFRILLCVLIPYGLVGDESYYWDWGRHPSWGYYSKPPMIGWLMMLLRLVGADTVDGIRCTAALFGTGSLVFVLLFVKYLYSARIAFWSIVLMVASPGHAVLNLIFTIDAPLCFFWSGALYTFARATRKEGRTAPYWIALAVFLGLGYLAKQMMLVFPAIALCFMILEPTARRHLRKPLAWICLAISFTSLIPTLLWNAANEWITWGHTVHHFKKESWGVLDILDRIGFFVGTQMGVISPLTWLLVLVVTIGLLTRWRKLVARERFLFLFSFPALAVFVILAFKQHINPNWPAVHYLTILVAVTAWALGELDLAGRFLWFRRRFMLSIRIGAVLGGILCLAPITVGPLLQGTSLHPFSRLDGWEAYAEEIQTLRRTVPRPDRTFVMVVGHRDHVSQLAFHLPDRPEVFRWEEEGVIVSQYELWPDPEGYEGWDALVIAVQGERVVSDTVRARFDEMVLLHEFAIFPEAKKPREYAVLLGKNWREP